jgi:hypothetical protein
MLHETNETMLEILKLFLGENSKELLWQNLPVGE